MNIKILTLLSALVLFCSIPISNLFAYHADVLSPPASTAWYVDASISSGDGLMWSSAYADLQDALLQAGLNAGDTIFVAEGNYYPDQANGMNTQSRDASFIIPSGVVVLGGFPTGGGDLASRDWEMNKTILSGDIDQLSGNADNAYHVVRTTKASAQTVVDGFCIVEGNADGGGKSAFGGGWFNEGSDLNAPSNATLSNCRFENNSADFGGAMYNDGNSGECSPVLTNCVFKMNSADYGGAMYNDGNSGECSPVLTNCVFKMNSASQIGGGILNDAFKGQCTPTFIDCVFNMNSAIGSGGAMYNLTNDGQCSPLLINCVFLNNTAFDGGGIYNIVFLGECSPTLINCQFEENTATNNGAGIYNIASSNGESSPVLSNCLFTGNTAVADGGGIYSKGSNGVSSPIMINCTFSKNQAPEGGALYNIEDAGGTCEPNIVNSIIWGNGVNYLINANGASPKMTNSLYHTPFPIGTVDGGGLIGGVPFFVSDSNFRLTVCSPAINAGSNDSIPAGITIDLDSNIRIFDMTVDMGAFEYQDIVPDATVLYVDSTSTDGDGLSWATALAKLQDALASGCLHAGDTIFVAQGSYYPDEGIGQTPDSRNASFHILDSIVVLGGFPTGGGSLASRDWEMNKTILSGDIDQLSGNADNAYQVVRTTKASAQTVVDGFCIVEGNADGGGKSAFGGGWFNEGSDLNAPSNATLSNCRFENNSADFGGAMYNDGNSGECSPVLTNCVFKMNSADYGGAMYNDGNSGECSPVLTNCVFKMNSASQIGGGILNDAFKGQCTPTFIDCVFNMNSAIGSGGAMYNLTNDGQCSPLLINCVFLNNTAFDGGGIYNIVFLGECSPTLINCQFEENTATNNGAGIYNIASSNGESSPVLSNCLFTGNTAVADGGGIYSKGSNGVSSPVMINCTFSRNQAPEGSALYNIEDGGGSSEPNIVNSILWDNGINYLFNENGASPILTNSIYLEPFPSGTIDGGGLKSDDPLFVSTTDLHLQPCSPAIDAGDNSALPAGVTTDLDGNPRVFNATALPTSIIDIGAFEMPTDNTLPTNWTGLGDGLLWSDALNWDDEFIPQTCRDIIIPSGTATVPAGFEAQGKSLDVLIGAQLITDPAGVMDIKN